MALPKISHPTFDVTIPSTKTKIKMRTMTVKEEKILLMAKEAANPADIMESLVQVVNNCIVTKNVDVHSLAIFDIEYLFVKLRGFSVSNKIKLSYIDNEDQQTYGIEIDTESLEVRFPENVKNTFQLDTELSLKLGYPSVKFYDNKELFSSENPDYFNELFKASSPALFGKQETFNLKNASKEELKEFIESLPSKTYNEISEYFDNLPSLYHEASYTTKNGTERKFVFSKLDDFFTLA